MTPLLLAGATFLLLAAMSLFAARHVAPGAERLTMQWRRDGAPAWSLPRAAALAFMPVLGAVVLAATASIAEPDALPVVCVVLPAAHALHLFLLRKRG